MSDNGELNILIRFRADLDRAIADSKKGMGQISDDAKKGSEALGLASKAGGGLLSVMKNLAGPVLAFFTAQGISNFIRGIASAFMEGESATARLSSVLKISRGDYEAMKPAIEEVARELAAFGFENNQVSKAVADMTLRNYSLRQSLDIVRAAAKLAIVENLTLEEATRQIALAANGVLRPGTALGAVLGDLRSELEKGGDKAKNLALILGRVEQLSGAAAQQAGTLAGATRRLRMEWAELQESLGQSAFGDWLKNFTKGFAESLKVVREWIDVTREAGDTAELRSLIDRISILQNRLYAAKAGKGTPMELQTYFGNIPLPFGGSKEKVDPLENELKDLYARLAQIRQRMGQKQDEDRARAEEAECAQSQALWEQTYKQQLAANEKMLDKEKYQRAQAEADIFEAIQTKQAAERQQQFQDELKSTLASGAAKAQIIRDFFEQEKQFAKDSAEYVAKIRQDADNAEAVRIAKNIGTVSAEQVLAVAKLGSQQPTKIDEFVRGLPMATGELKEVNDQITRLSEGFRKADDALNTSLRSISRYPKQQSELVGSAFADGLALRSKEIQGVDLELTQRVAIIETQRNVGNIRDREAQRQIIEAQTIAAKNYSLQLLDNIEMRKQVEASPDIADATRVELMRTLNNQIADLNVKILQLKPSLEATARASENVFVGMQLGMQRIQDRYKSFALMTADVMDELATGMSHAFAASFVSMIRGTQDFATAFRQMASDVLARIAEMIAEQAILNALGGAGGGGKQASGLMGFLGSLFGGASSGSPSSVGMESSPAEIGAFFSGYAEGGYVGDPAVPIGLPRSADDRFLVAVRGGEGFIRPEAVDWLGGVNAIRAINRMQLPELQVPRLHFASGGVVPAIAASGAASAQRLSINNIVAIGPEHLKRIAASSENHNAIGSYISVNARNIAQALKRYI